MQCVRKNTAHTLVTAANIVPAVVAYKLLLVVFLYHIFLQYLRSSLKIPAGLSRGLANLVPPAPSDIDNLLFTSLFQGTNQLMLTQETAIIIVSTSLPYLWCTVRIELSGTPSLLSGLCVHVLYLLCILLSFAFVSPIFDNDALKFHYSSKLIKKLKGTTVRINPYNCTKDSTKVLD